MFFILCTRYSSPIFTCVIILGDVNMFPSFGCCVGCFVCLAWKPTMILLVSTLRLNRGGSEKERQRKMQAFNFSEKNAFLTPSDKCFVGLQLLHIRATQPLIIFTLKDFCFLSSLSLHIFPVSCNAFASVQRCSLSRI